jgi:hypothetical protein
MACGVACQGWGRGLESPVCHLSNRSHFAEGIDPSRPGTEGSNPAPSSAESATNLVAAGRVARGWDSEFESALLQRGVSNEPWGVARGWDSGFESALLQQGVYCEPKADRWLQDPSHANPTASAFSRAGELHGRPMLIGYWPRRLTAAARIRRRRGRVDVSRVRSLHHALNPAIQRSERSSFERRSNRRPRTK